MGLLDTMAIRVMRPPGKWLSVFPNELTFIKDEDLAELAPAIRCEVERALNESNSWARDHLSRCWLKIDIVE